VNLPAQGDGRGGDEVHVLHVRDDHRVHDVRDARDDHGVPSGADHLVLRPVRPVRSRMALDRRGIQRAWAGTEGKVRGEESRGGTIHDGEVEVEVEGKVRDGEAEVEGKVRDDEGLEGKVRDDEGQEGTVHEVKGEDGLANLREGTRRHHPLAGAHCG